MNHRDTKATEREPTKGPWIWKKVGKTWVLWGEHGMRPIVLDCYRGQLRVRNSLGLMVPFDPEHPDAKLIESAPMLLAQNEDLKGQAVASVCEVMLATQLIRELELENEQLKMALIRANDIAIERGQALIELRGG